ncbi:formate dehydrogenase subunit gamma [Thioclava sp. F42-5]|uniref:formate dehydrogenase subunit gamma n=1 Tax=Thioclava sp. F42-5 TaxID=1973005 RepID=UPI000B53EA85|nr:formate dehydrogenase subunit gamma [Thioclava sp. F42-5]OWY08757.1 formate dehydrogenase subunit gamma [Thioclava sp. F42-5]
MAQPATVIDGDEIARIVDAHRALEGPLLPMLHALQEAFGYIPTQAHGPICDALNITRAELHGVITFYHDFREKPAGRHVLKICRAEACRSVGGAAVADALLAKLGLEWHDTTANGAVTIEPVYCLGMCACAPAAMVDDRVVGRVDAAKLDKLLAEMDA